MRINFEYENIKYKNAIDSIIDPIIKYLPIESYIRTTDDEDGYLNVSLFLENIPHKGVFTAHGVACKDYFATNRLGGYLKVCVSGTRMRDRLILEGYPEEKLFINGFSKLDPIFNGDIKRTQNNKTVVGFFPTHNSWQEVSIQDKYDHILKLIPDKYSVISSNHPATKKDSSSTLQLLADADIVVSDCSSIIYEAFALNKQVIFLDWLVKDYISRIFKNSFEHYIYTNNIGLHANNELHFLELLNYASENELDKKTKEFTEGIFPLELRGNSGKNMADMLFKEANK